MKHPHLSSPENERVKSVLRLRQQKHRWQSGLFIAEGPREVSRALQADLRLVELFWCPSLLKDHQARIPHWQNLAPPSARLFTVSEAVMAKLAYRQNPEGVLAVFEQPRWSLRDFPPPVQGAVAAAPTSEGSNPNELWLVAAGLEKPGNLGALARTAAAAGCRGLIVEGGVADIFNPNAIRASTGAVFDLPVIAADFDEVTRFFGDRGVRVFGLTPTASRSYDQADWREPAAVVVGAEDRGLHDRWLALTNRQDPQAPFELVSIPMAPTAVDSLNASIAAAVVLFEAARQRRTLPAILLDTGSITEKNSKEGQSPSEAFKGRNNHD